MERIPHPFVPSVTDQYEEHNCSWGQGYYLDQHNPYFKCLKFLSVVCESVLCESAVCHVCSLSLPGHDRYKLSTALGTSLATQDSVTVARERFKLP